MLLEESGLRSLHKGAITLCLYAELGNEYGEESFRVLLKPRKPLSETQRVVYETPYNNIGPSCGAQSAMFSKTPVLSAVMFVGRETVCQLYGKAFPDS